MRCVSKQLSSAACAPPPPAEGEQKSRPAGVLRTLLLGRLRSCVRRRRRLSACVLCAPRALSLSLSLSLSLPPLSAATRQPARAPPRGRRLQTRGRNSVKRPPPPTSSAPNYLLGRPAGGVACTCGRKSRPLGRRLERASPSRPAVCALALWLARARLAPGRSLGAPTWRLSPGQGRADRFMARPHNVASRPRVARGGARAFAAQSLIPCFMSRLLRGERAIDASLQSARSPLYSGQLSASAAASTSTSALLSCGAKTPSAILSQGAHNGRFL